MRKFIIPSHQWSTEKFPEIDKFIDGFRKSDTRTYAVVSRCKSYLNAKAILLRETKIDGKICKKQRQEVKRQKKDINIVDLVRFRFACEQILHDHFNFESPLLNGGLSLTLVGCQMTWVINK